MKWKEFKDKVEAAGMKDDDEIWYIDITFDNPFEISNRDKIGWAVG